MVDRWIKILYENRTNINKLKLEYDPKNGGNREEFETLQEYLEDLQKTCPKWHEKVRSLNDMARVMRGKEDVDAQEKRWIKILYENRANINKLKLEYHPDKGGDREEFETLQAYLNKLQTTCPKWREKVHSLNDMARVMRGQLLKEDVLTFSAVKEEICKILQTVTKQAPPKFLPDGWGQETNGFISETIEMYMADFAQGLKQWKTFRVVGINDCATMIRGPKRYFEYTISKDYPWQEKLVERLRSPFDPKRIETLEDWLMLPDGNVTSQWEQKLAPRSEWEAKIHKQLSEERGEPIKEKKKRRKIRDNDELENARDMLNEAKKNDELDNAQDMLNEAKKTKNEIYNTQDTAEQQIKARKIKRGANIGPDQQDEPSDGNEMKGKRKRQSARKDDAELREKVKGRTWKETSQWSDEANGFIQSFRSFLGTYRNPDGALLSSHKTQPHYYSDLVTLIDMVGWKACFDACSDRSKIKQLVESVGWRSNDSNRTGGLRVMGAYLETRDSWSNKVERNFRALSK